jgi:DNA invertase Pin-like site-specific DNA recombinase
MRAVLYEQFRRAPELVSVPDPECPEAGVVIEVAATGLCRSDWHGWMGHDPDIRLPHVPGHELSGAVAEVGPEVRDWSRGDRVTVPFVCACGECDTCRRGEQQVCERQCQPGFTGWGSFAELVAIDRAESEVTTRCAIYARISKDDAKTGLGVERQQADCEALADRRGWPIVRPFVDNSKSAYSGKRRPQYTAMMDALAAGEIDAIVVYHADRLYRRLGDMVPFLDAVQAAGATVETVAGGVIDLTTAAGRMAARLAGVIAAGESERASERIIRQRLELRASGRPMGGWRGYGYTLPIGEPGAQRIAVDEAEAAFIRQAAAALLSGTSLRSTTRQLNAAGSRTPRGNQWRPDQLKTTLLLDHAAILSAADADQLVRTLRRPENAILRGRTPGHLLSGLLRCGRCGSKLIASLGTYRCPGKDLGGCNGIGIHQESTDTEITSRVLGAYGSTRPVAFVPPIQMSASWPSYGGAAWKSPQTPAWQTIWCWCGSPRWIPRSPRPRAACSWPPRNMPSPSRPRRCGLAGASWAWTNAALPCGPSLSGSWWRRPIPRRRGDSTRTACRSSGC